MPISHEPRRAGQNAATFPPLAAISGFPILSLVSAILLAACATTAPTPAPVATPTTPVAVSAPVAVEPVAAPQQVAQAKPAVKKPSAAKSGAGLFSDITQPGKDTPKPRAQTTTAVTKEGTIIPGAVNVYTFDPDESFVPVNPMSTSIAQVLADLGPDAIEWYQHVQTLSNPWFEGRAPGSEGIEHAAEYCEFYMKKAGLTPAFESGPQANAADPWRQPFDLPGRTRTVKSSALKIGESTIEGDAGTAKAMKNSGGGRAAMPLAFAGYAIESGQDGYTSFATDERFDGRVVMILRGEPLTAEGKSLWGGEKFTSASSLATKITAVKSRGAAGIVVVEPPNYAGKKVDLLTLSADSLGGEMGIPCFFADATAAAAILKACDSEGRDLTALCARANAGTKDAPATTVLGKDDVAVDLNVHVDNGDIVTHNVGGILAGRGPLASEWIIVGAHYDHVGYGAYGADPANRGKVHPGADDNASGTSGMLVLARRLSKDYADAPADANLRSVLFLAFSAEEVGLNGSRAYVKSPSVPADKVDIMLNMDMIGRMRAGEVVIGGIESAQGLGEQLAPMFKESGFTVHADPSGRGPSDHASFYGAGVPVLFFFSGVHDIYHKPGDQGFTVDPRGIPSLLSLVERIALWRAGSADRLVFSTPNTNAPAATTDRGYASVRLGIQPGMTEDGESGIMVESVSAGTSAADAGIKPGDVMLSWNGESLGSTADMMTKLRASKPGDVAKIRILRDGKELVIDVTLKASTARRAPAAE